MIYGEDIKAGSAGLFIQKTNDEKLAFVFFVIGLKDSVQRQTSGDKERE